jgi:hypothetical protein
MNRDAMPTQPSLPRPTPPPAASYANTPYTPAGAAPGKLLFTGSQGKGHLLVLPAPGRNHVLQGHGPEKR